jgi:hypothetical protein
VTRYPQRMRRCWLLFSLLLVAAPAAAKDSLGVFDDWGAFRDPAVPRCYAITAAEKDKAGGPYEAYADVGTWPRRNIRGQVHFRTSREMAKNSRISLFLGGKRYELTGGGADAWTKDGRMEAAVVAAMRSAEEMSLSAIDVAGRRFTDRYSLKGAPTAMDAATVGCARVR